MTDILVRHQYSQKQIDRAETKASEFRPTRYTSGVANLDDMVALGKAVILCSDHVRKFSPKAAKYCLHPDKRLRKVLGNCDICKQFGNSTLFLNEKDAFEERKKLEKFNRALEYGCLVTS